MSSIREPLIIDRPELLATLALEGISSLSLEPGADVETSADVKDEHPEHDQEVVLVLLQPLADSDILARCRGQTRSPVFEMLNIQHLSAIWRRALADARPIRHLTFDLALPDVRVTEAGTTKVLRWNDDLAIMDVDVLSMVHSIATMERMRVRDGIMQFKALHPSHSMMNPKASSPSKVGTTVQQSLDAIAQYRKQS